ncbi:MAG: hypothetical protein WAO19_10815, partial [Candidatus Kryptoniota bacterium]
MKSHLLIPAMVLFLSTMSFAQSNGTDIDPFLGHYTLGGRSDLIIFSPSYPDTGSQLGYGFFSNDSAQHAVLQHEAYNRVISADGVSGNFLMGSTSDLQRDEAVYGTMEADADSFDVVRLYVNEWINGA